HLQCVVLGRRRRHDDARRVLHRRDAAPTAVAEGDGRGRGVRGPAGARGDRTERRRGAVRRRDGRLRTGPGGDGAHARRVGAGRSGETCPNLRYGFADEFRRFLTFRESHHDAMLNGYRNGNPAGGPQARLSLLLVEGDEARADRMERHLNAHIAGLVATRCTTLAAARAYLAGSTFDAVCIAEELPDGAGMALVEFCDGLGVRPPLFVRSGTHPPAAGEPHAVKAGPACYTLPADEAAAAAAVGRALRGSGGAVVREEAAAPAAEERDEMAGLLEA